MAKTKEPKTSSKSKSEVKSISAVKNASVTKPSQTPNAKSKQIAKETATKVNGKKASKPVVKAPSPSDSESSDSASSDSESEAEVKKPVANGKANGNTNGASKKEVDSSDSDSSSASSDSSDEDSEADSDSPKKSAAASDSEDSDDSASESDSEEETKPAAVVKDVAKKAAATGKAAVNGAAKVVAKATKETDSEADSDDSNSSDSSEEDGSDSGSGSDSSDSESEKEAPSKKRKADDEPEAAAKKSKTEAVDDNGSKNLFVGNLSWNVDDEWLMREFEEFGEISGARVISDKATGRSKGFGYVEFTSSASAAAALKAKKGGLIDGREANVDFSTPRSDAPPRERAQGRAAAFGDSQNPPSDTLFLGNLSFDADENTVGEAFGEHGTVINVRLPTDMETGNPKGFGYVTFGSIDDAKTAFEAMTGADIAGRPVRLDYATPKPDRSEGGGRGGGRGGRGGFDRGGRGGGRGRGGFNDRGRGGRGGGRGGSTNRGGFGDFKGKKQTF